jgi:hypothetical protein
MIVKSVVPDIKDTILELRVQGKSDDQILATLLLPDNLDLFFSEAQMESEDAFTAVDHLDTINEAFRQLIAEEKALFAHPNPRGMSTKAKLGIAGAAVLSAGLFARWLSRREPSDFLMPSMRGLGRTRAVLPRDPCDWDQEATREIYRALGIRGKRIPADMHGEFWLDTWNVVIKRGGEGARIGKPRMFVRWNGKLYSVKNLRQNLCPAAMRAQVRRGRRTAAKQRRRQGRFY